MTFINYASREINCKIVYYGPGLCGKTTNLQHIYDSTAPQAKGKLISLATETDRTLFFDFMPLELGTVRGFKTRFHLYTVPGQVFYEASRKLILKGVDGVVFVADSQEERMDANIESVYNLEENLRSYGYELMKLPYVLQLNKRDLPNVVPTSDLTAELQRKGEPVVEAVASHVKGNAMKRVDLLCAHIDTGFKRVVGVDQTHLAAAAAKQFFEELAEILIDLLKRVAETLARTALDLAQGFFRSGDPAGNVVALSG